MNRRHRRHASRFATRLATPRLGIAAILARASCGGGGTEDDRGANKTYLRVEATGANGDTLQYQWRATAGLSLKLLCERNDPHLVLLVQATGRDELRPAGLDPQLHRQKAGKTNSCVRIVSHTSRTGSARADDVLSRQRAEAVQRMLERDNRAVAAQLSAAGAGSHEGLVGLGTDDARDAIDRRVGFRMVDCV